MGCAALPRNSASVLRCSLAQIGRFIEHYNHQRYHESLENLTPADVFFGRDKTILQERHRTKQKTIEHRRLQHIRSAA